MGLGAILLLVAASQAIAAVSVLTPTVVWIPEEYHSGGAYTAIQAASDGRVYLGTTFYDGFARFLVLQPGGREFQLVADMASATGESAPGPYSQAKIHTKPAVAPDGKVYFGTKSGKPAKDARWQANYPGGHLLVYDPQTNRVADLGIIRPRQSIITVGVDPSRNVVHAVTDPDGHLNVYNPRTRTFTDKGPFATTDQPSRYPVILANGDAFHVAGTDAFMHYQASSGTIQRLPLQMTGRGTYEHPYALAVNSAGARFHGVGESTGEVYTFTPGDRSIAVQLHGVAPTEGAFGRRSYYTMTAAPDGNIYYILNAAGSALYLFRLVSPSGQLEVVGQVGSLPPPPASVQRRSPPRLLVQGSTTAPDGTLYVMLAYPLRILIFPKIAAKP